MPGELENAVKFRCNHTFTLYDIANTLQHLRKRTNIGKYTPYKSSGFKEKQTLTVEFKNKPRERMAEVAKKKKFFSQLWFNRPLCQQLSKGKEKGYSIEKVSGEESPQEYYDPDSMGDAIREPCDDDQDPREELLVEDQEETPPEIQDIQLEAGMPPDTANKSL
ncbi:hypothetical protein O181_005325 [Austropuccinia psidii MF-1]|uniref:Uncharacterized protein n=1 Tax=Austropuccinia psidii MF-1 TaxID=1389203 RepID=A0A9Q3GFQ7_9BASI|nr:hypothetical protein [Austropuccinia psidii MF-1]